MNNMIIAKAVHDIKTPFYLYNENDIITAIKLLMGVLPQSASLVYSLKANPNTEIVKIIRNNQIATEISSIGEMQTACNAIVKPENIIFSGPGKNKEELRFAIEKKIFCINAESLDEIMLIDEISAKCDKITNVAVRVNPNMNSSKTAIKMTGMASQFGMDDDSLDEAVSAAKNFKNINIIGVQLYNGTQLLNYEDILANVNTCLEYSKNLSSKYGLDFSYINFGGGFGVPYFSGEKELDYCALKTGLEKLFSENHEHLENMRCVFESGRFLTADAGVFVTQILYKKVSHSKTFLICDGGSNFHANSAFLGRRIRYNFPIKVLTANLTEVTEQVTVTGSLCTPTDIIAQDIILPRCEPGDYIIIEKSGAYGLTNSPVLFISYPLPSEILYANDELRKI